MQNQLIAEKLATTKLFATHTLTAKFASDCAATLYVASDAAGREVLVRILHDHLADDPRHVEAFLAEGREGLALGARAQVPVLEVGVRDEMPYWVLALVAGRAWHNQPARPAFQPITRWLPVAA